MEIIPEPEVETPTIEQIDYAQSILRGITGAIRESWNGYGVRLWIDYEIKRLEEMKGNANGADAIVNLKKGD